MNRGRPGWLGMDQGRLDILKDPERLACVPETTAALILELVDAFDELTTADDLKRGQLENAKMAASHNLHDVAVLHEQRREWTETRKRLTRDWKTALGERDAANANAKAYRSRLLIADEDVDAAGVTTASCEWWLDGILTRFDRRAKTEWKQQSTWVCTTGPGWSISGVINNVANYFDRDRWEVLAEMTPFESVVGEVKS